MVAHVQCLFYQLFAYHSGSTKYNEVHFFYFIEGTL
jgi:hypothetical protein